MKQLVLILLLLLSISCEIRQDQNSMIRNYNDSKSPLKGIPVFTDLTLGIDYSIQKEKPIFLWITSFAGGCTRKMEEVIFKDQIVFSKLQNEFVVICLFVDDKSPLQQEEYWVYNGKTKKLKTKGDKNIKYQIEKFNSNTQPLYAVLEPSSNEVLIQFGYLSNSPKVDSLLAEGIIAFEKSKSQHVNVD